MLLDTDFIIDVMADHETAVSLLDTFEMYGEPMFVSSVTLFELYHSLARVDQPEERLAEIQDVLDDRPVLDADAEVMKTAGRLHGELVASGNEVPPLDVIIGATGFVHGEWVLTGNRSDFERIQEAVPGQPGLYLHVYEK